MSGRLGDRFASALRYAHEIHRSDTRKGSSTPYVSHLLAVCALVLEDGGDEDEAIAALLHDTIEDHADEVTRVDLEARFGTRVAEMVVACTDTPPDYRGGEKPPWRERKEAYVARLRGKKYPGCRLALADKLHNLRTTVTDYRRQGDGIWKKFNAGKEDQLWYHGALVEAFREAGATGPLAEEFERCVTELRRLARAEGS